LPCNSGFIPAHHRPDGIRRRPQGHIAYAPVIIPEIQYAPVIIPEIQYAAAGVFIIPEIQYVATGDSNDAMHVVRHDDEFAKFDIIAEFTSAHPFIMRNLTECVELHLAVNYLSEATNSILTTNRNKIQALSGIVIAFLPDGLSMVDFWIVFYNKRKKFQLTTLKIDSITDAVFEYV